MLSPAISAFMIALLLLAHLSGLTGTESRVHAAGKEGVPVGSVLSNGMKPSVFVDNGTPYVFYRDNGMAAVKKFDGTSWQSVGSNWISLGNVYYNAFFVENGAPWVAYSDNSIPPPQNKATVVNKFEAGSWINYGTISDGGTSANHLQVCNGTPYVTYKDASTATIHV